MIIGVCGFGYTGSGAVLDYLREFEGIQVLDDVEFTWVSGVDGLIDLDYHLNHPHTRTSDSIYALSRYRKKAVNSFWRYRRVFDSRVLLDSTDKFLDSITQVSWNWYISGSNKFIEKRFKPILKRIITEIEERLGQQIDCWPLQKVSLSVFPSNFEEAAKIHVKELLSALGADFTRPVVIDQAFAGNNPQACFKFYDDPYAVLVDRDPRDTYVFAKEMLAGRNHFMPIETVQDFVIYYKALRDKQPYKAENERVLYLRFEDLIYNYENTTTRLKDFLHLPEISTPKKYFDPSRSIANTQIWKRYPKYEKDINYIEKELSEYLFDFSKYANVEVKGAMFR